MNRVSRFTCTGLVAIGLLAFAERAGAVSLCASTAAELHDDLVAASDGGTYAGKDVEIDLVQGTFKTGAVTGNGPFAYNSTATTGQIILSGGWGPDCSTFLRDARVTVLDGRNLTQVLNIQNKNATVFVEFLTIQNGESAVAGGGVAINTNVTGGSAHLAENFIRSNHTASIGGGFAIDGGGNQVSVSNNVVYGNSADGGFGAGFEYSRGGAAAFVDSNTMTKNTTTAAGGTGGLYCCGTAGIALIEGNILWQNTNFGIDLETPDYSFEYNDYGTATGTLNPDSTNMSKDPKFINADNNNYRLAGNSPLLGVYRAQSFPDSDLVGNAYPFPVNGYFDIGAFEDTVFTDRGFESN